MAKQDLSAKDFREDLLRVLADKTGLKANKPVKHDDVYDSVAQLKGVTRDQYGSQDGTKIQWVDRWIQWAFKALVQEGLGAREGRGQWALTKQGVKVARGITQANPGTQNVTADDAGDVTASPAVSLVVGPGQAEDAYHTDPYVRALAARDTTCFSSYSDKSDRCSKCLLSGSCMNAMAAELSSLARELAQEDKEAVSHKKKVSLPDPKPKDDSDSKPAQTGGSKAQVSGEVSQITIQQQALCKHCGQTIPKGDDGFWIRSSGTTNGGLYHLDCLEVK